MKNVIEQLPKKICESHKSEKIENYFFFMEFANSNFFLFNKDNFYQTQLDFFFEYNLKRSINS